MLFNDCRTVTALGNQQDATDSIATRGGREGGGGRGKAIQATARWYVWTRNSAAAALAARPVLSVSN